MSAGFRRAKIVATVGPASCEPEVLRALIQSGADAVRINFSHADHEEAAAVLRQVRKEADRLTRPLAIIADLQGPRIRVADLDRPLAIQEGVRYWFVPEGSSVPAAVERERTIPTTYGDLAADVAREDRILLDDGRLEFEVVDVRDACVVARARTSGTLESQKGMNLPGVEVRAPSLTEKDREDLAFLRDRAVEYVALSFVRRPEDLEEARRELDPGALLIAKIEKDRALERLVEIVEQSNAVMVARGDLGVELPYEEVPIIQKRIIRLAVERARPVITATQMLESMREHPRPTRAEVSDVANALLDGTDAVMLSGETAIGEYPVEAVSAMDRIIRRVEQEVPRMLGRVARRTGEERARVQQTTSGAVAAASLQAVERLGSPFICTFTRSGFTARVVSAQRPPVPILAVSDEPRTYHQLALAWGVHPILFQGEVGYESMLEAARKEALEGNFGEPGDRFVVTAGVPFHEVGTTNMMRIETL